MRSARRVPELPSVRPLEYWSTPSAGRVLSSTRALPSVGWRGQALLNGVLEAAESSSDRGAEAYGRARAHNMVRVAPRARVI